MIMDAQNILQSLASLRDSLEAIDSARKQVQDNVACYETVRSQLAATAQSVEAILSGFDSIVELLNKNQHSLGSDIDDMKAAIVETLKLRADEISRSTASAVQQLRSSASDSTAELASTLETMRGDFSSSCEALLHQIAESLAQLNANASNHISKYEAFEADFSKEVKSLAEYRKDFDQRHVQLQTQVKSECSRIETSTKAGNQELRDELEALKAHVDKNYYDLKKSAKLQIGILTAVLVAAATILVVLFIR